MIHLRSKDNKAICKIAEESFSTPIEILAYGSRVNGDSHDASDLDIVIRKSINTEIIWDEFIEFKERLDDSTIPILIQSFIWKMLPETFHKNILQKYEVLFKN